MRTGSPRATTTPNAKRSSQSQPMVQDKRGPAKKRRAPNSNRSRRKPRAKQGELLFRSWGGARKGAGRKPKGERAMAPHDTRPAHGTQFPVLITTRLHSGLPSLRHAPEAARILAALACANADANASANADVNACANACAQADANAVASADASGEQTPRAAHAHGGCATPPFQVVHHSIQSNHLHLIVEASDRANLTSGLRGLLARIARALNRFWGRRGSVFADRFHERELRNPRQVRNALVYVLQNLRKHGISVPGPDPLSSGPDFDGWNPVPANELGRGRPAGPDAAGSASWSGFLAQLKAARAEPPSPKTWLLGFGWRTHGLIHPGETPKAH